MTSTTDEYYDLEKMASATPKAVHSSELTASLPPSSFPSPAYESDQNWKDSALKRAQSAFQKKLEREADSIPAVAKASSSGTLPYTHEAMVEMLIEDPVIKPSELARRFNLSPGWISRMLASDSFNARLAQRKQELLDPTLSNILNERVRTVTIHALDVLNERLSAEQSAAIALETLGTLFVGEVASQLSGRK